MVNMSNGLFGFLKGIHMLKHMVNSDSPYLKHLQFLPNSRVASIGTVLAQGMNTKKKHEVGN